MVAPSGLLVLTTDAVVEGVHADLSLVGLDDLGWKAVAVNVSDVAAVGGRPLHALVAVAGPPSTDLDLLADGIASAAAEWDVGVVGGDLTNAPVLVVAVALTGQVEGGEPVRRSGARPGDVLWVSGPLGASAAGLRAMQAGQWDDPNARRHRRPRARPDVGQVVRRAGATAMIDVSDGLAADAGHVATASGVGIALDVVPVAAGATEEDALGGGEDYELVFTLPSGTEPPAGAIRIGTCTDDPRERTLRGEPLPRTGWEHGFS